MDLTAPILNDRLGGLSDYPFTRLAALLGGITPPANTPPLAMSVGEPQHTPPDLLARALAAAPLADWGRYPPTAGTPALRAAVAGWLTRRYGLPQGYVDPGTDILPAAGTREALFQVALLATPSQRTMAQRHPDRRQGRQPAVLIPNPFYAVYEGAAALAGAEPVFLPATRETGFLPDLDALTPELLERTSLFYLCTPSNPQGAVASLDYLTRALTLARTYGFILAVDECYAEIWDRTPPPGGYQAALALDEAAVRAGATAPGPRNLLVFNSLSKRSSAAGLRSGFIAGDPALIAAFARLRSYALAGNPLPAQAAAAALWADDAHVAENRRLYRLKFDAAQAELEGKLGFFRPDAGFFLWLDVGDGEAAAQALWREAGVRVLPGAYLSRPPARPLAHPDAGADGAMLDPGRRYIRVALVHDADTVARACREIARILG